MKVALVPEPQAWPKSGGVRQHCLMLHRYLQGYVELAPPSMAHIVHVQSAFASDRVDVYTCHGGFTPHPIALVYRHLKAATNIISVATWMINDFFPEYAYKTTVIPNGVDVSEWEDLPDNILGLEPGFVLTKGYNAITEHWRMVLDAAKEMCNYMFVSIGSPVPVKSSRLLPNFVVIPEQPHDVIKGLFNDCLCYVSPSSEVNPVFAMEAMAACRPVIGLDLHGNQEVLCQDLLYSGSLQLQFLIEAAATDQLDSLVRANRQLVEEKYNWQRIVKRTVAVYEKLLTAA
jgi:glycosyltransferase involved in cell wall biosynthesis